MFKFVHISDFHLNKASLDDWKNFVKPAFVDLVKREFPGGNAIILCTGDLLDKGGKDFGDISQGFNIFKTEVIEPLTTELQIPLSNFICIPGNHDIARDADSKVEKMGLISLIKDSSVEDINDYAKALSYDNPQQSKRVLAYKEFERSIYPQSPDIQLSFLGSSFIIYTGCHRIGISAFNTVWNCSDDNDLQNGIFISEAQYNACKSVIKDCDLKIALMHHPLDWLTKEKESIQAWIKNDYDVLLDGHIHKSDTSIITKVYGSLFIDTAPAFENDIRGNDSKGSFTNGVNVIEIDDDKNLITLKELRYVHQSRSYPDVIPQPMNFVSYSSEEERIVAKCIEYIQKKHYAAYDNSIIPHKAAAIQTLKDAFILPPIEKNGDVNNTRYTLSDLLNNNANIVLYGSHESGKSTLLYRMVMELLDNHNIFQTIPAYLDFNAIGNRDIETCLKEYLDCNSSELRTLLSGNFITLFLDNYSPNENSKPLSNKICQFVKGNNIKLIATHNSELKGSIDMVFSNNNQLAFETYYIKPFNAENIRQLMVKWSPGVNFEETNAKLQSMVSNFHSYSLPCSAMAVSLYLWSTENTDKKPVNPALLLDIFLEIILEKMNPEYLYRDSFDYENKIMMLANIAKYVHDELEKDLEFRLTYAQYITCITSYLKSVGFEKVEADKIGNYFIEQKVFIKQGNNVDFSHSCFYHFLLAKRMFRDASFRDHVLSEAQYYRYERVIDYYAGLNRSDRSLLQEMLNRFNNFFSPLDEVIDEINREMDNSFTYIKQGQTFTPIIGTVSLKKASEDKGNQEDVEKRANKVFDEKMSRIADDYASPKTMSPEEMIVMLAKSLRNLDGVEDVALKKAAYSSLVKKSLAYTFILKDSLAKYANDHSGILPPAFSSIDNVPLFFRYMPFFLQCSLHEIMGSTKLFTPIKAKISEDARNKSTSDIERYFSIAMVWDSTGLENEKEMQALIKRVGNNCVQDYLLNKVYYKFKNFISVGSPEEEKCISLLADLQVKGKKLKLLAKGQVMSNIRKEREKYFKEVK